MKYFNEIESIANSIAETNLVCINVFDYSLGCLDNNVLLTFSRLYNAQKMFKLDFVPYINIVLPSSFTKEDKLLASFLANSFTVFNIDIIYVDYSKATNTNPEFCGYDNAHLLNYKNSEILFSNVANNNYDFIMSDFLCLEKFCDNFILTVPANWYDINTIQYMQMTIDYSEYAKENDILCIINNKKQARWHFKDSTVAIYGIHGSIVDLIIEFYYCSDVQLKINKKFSDVNVNYAIWPFGKYTGNGVQKELLGYFCKVNNVNKLFVSNEAYEEVLDIITSSQCYTSIVKFRDIASVSHNRFLVNLLECYNEYSYNTCYIPKLGISESYDFVKVISPANLTYF